MHKGFDERHASIAGMFGMLLIISKSFSHLKKFVVPKEREFISLKILQNQINMFTVLEVVMDVVCIKINRVIFVHGKHSRKKIE